MSEGFKKAEAEENVKKRKASTPSGPASKKAKIDKMKDKCSDNKKQTKLTKSPLKSSSSIDKKHKSNKDSPKKKSKSAENIVGSKLKKQKGADSSEEEDIPLSSLKSTPSKSKTPTKNGKSTPKKNTPSKKKDVINVDSDSDDDRPLSDVRPLSKIKSGKSPKKVCLIYTCTTSKVIYYNYRKGRKTKNVCSLSHCLKIFLFHISTKKTL